MKIAHGRFRNRNKWNVKAEPATAANANCVVGKFI